MNVPPGLTAPPRVEKRPRRVVEPRKRSTRPTELDVVEAEIETAEAAVAELEKQLAEDWTNIDTIAAHRRARQDLEALLSRWEALFERSQA